MIATYITCKARGNPKTAPSFASAMACSLPELCTRTKNDPEVTHRDRFFVYDNPVILSDLSSAGQNSYSVQSVM